MAGGKSFCEWHNTSLMKNVVRPIRCIMSTTRLTHFCKPSVFTARNAYAVLGVARTASQVQLDMATPDRLQEGVVALLPFDGNGDDQSGNGFHAVAHVSGGGSVQYEAFSNVAPLWRRPADPGYLSVRRNGGADTNLYHEGNGAGCWTILCNFVTLHNTSSGLLDGASSVTVELFYRNADASIVFGGDDYPVEKKMMTEAANQSEAFVAA